MTNSSTPAPPIGASGGHGMDCLRIQGGRTLHGTVPIAGAKNAALALMPASLLTSDPLILRHMPRLSDIRSMCSLLESLGVQCVRDGEGMVLTHQGGDDTRADYEWVRRMRASILVLGPLLARFGRAEVSLPGGCAIGARPVDWHLEGLRALGAEVTLENGYVHARAPGGARHAGGGGLIGGRVVLPYPSVGATETLLLAASLARGTTRIEGAAKEPEIVALADCLAAMGAPSQGAGTAVIEIEGQAQLHGADQEVIADRIEAGTYALAVAATGGELHLARASAAHLSATVALLEEVGVTVTEENRGALPGLTIKGPASRPFSLTTGPWPDHPTDLQAQWMALATVLDGQSTLIETVFEGRFMHVAELRRLAAEIDLEGSRARVRGSQLVGAPVMATDLRASVSLVIAGLVAKGETRVSRLYHLDRGYDRLHEKLAAVGADIVREPDNA